MKFAYREYVLMFATVAVVIFGITYLALRPQFAALKALNAAREQLSFEIEKDKSLISERPAYEAELRKLSKSLPQFPADKNMQVYWLSMMDALASKNGVHISRRQARDETSDGLIYELPIECGDWEADTKALCDFLFDLEFGEAMLEVRRLYVKTKAPGRLRGRFTLYCNYTKDRAGE